MSAALTRSPTFPWNTVRQFSLAPILLALPLTLPLTTSCPLACVVDWFAQLHFVLLVVMIPGPKLAHHVVGVRHMCVD